MRLQPADARARFAAARVIRLATAGPGQQPHLVPCTFALDQAGRIVIGIDSKPKSSTRLRRLANITGNPRVSLLADHYAEDWARLWWARADGMAAIEHGGPAHATGWTLLRGKYPQYAGQELAGPVIVVTIDSWTGWAFS
jgi:PPOX class probable F420-dependent enzyme